MTRPRILGTASVVALALSIAVGIRAQHTLDPITQDPPSTDARYPTSNRAVAIPSGGARMNGVLLLAQGAGPHASVILLHGFPGNQKNEDLAYAIRRAGWNVLTFQYRGTWGSEGNFSLSGALDDVLAALTFLKGPDGAGERGLPDQIVLIGHSVGGWAALMTAAKDHRVQAVASTAGFNVGRAARDLGNPEAYAMALKNMETNMLPLRGTSAETLVRERLAHSEEWDLARHVASLSQRTLLLVGGQRDTVAAVAEHHTPLVVALQRKGAPKLTSTVLDADHAFSDKRVRLATTVVSWLDGLKPR